MPEDEEDSHLRSQIASLEKLDSTFNEAKFLKGAEIILVKIIEAFSKGNLEFLKKFTSNLVYEVYEKAIHHRDQLEQIRESSVENVVAKIVALDMDNLRDVRIKVEYLSDQKIITYEKDGTSYDNPSGLTVRTKDIWEFSRDIQNADPTWRLVSTKTAQV